MARVKASPEADALAAKEHLWLASVTVDGRHTNRESGSMNMTGAVTEKTRKMLFAAINNWIREEGKR